MYPDWLILAWVTIVGACIGSFLNVVIARLPAEESIVHPRSRCPRCKAPIAWYDNLPLLSFLILRGHCRACGTTIAPRYPLVELLMALLSAALWVRFGLSWQLLIWWPLVAALLAITFLDIDHWWVPDVITFPAMLWAMGGAFLPGGLTPVHALVGLIPAGLLWLGGFLFERFTGREGMGLGDVKLMAVIGLGLGVMDALSVLLLASVQGAVIGIVVTIRGGHKGVETETEDEPEGTDPADGDARRVDGKEIDNDNETGADGTPGASGDDDDDDWVPPPGAFPFGPFLVLGTLEILLLPGHFAGLLTRLTELLMGMFA